MKALQRSAASEISAQITVGRGALSSHERVIMKTSFGLYSQKQNLFQF
jgi:hypothetical protein